MNHQQNDLPVLSIIIVNYNGMKFLPACLRSLELWIRVSHEVIVVDNASSDSSGEYVATHFPQVKILLMKNNLGFARSNNIGADKARGRFLLFLNNDTELLDDIRPALQIFDQRQEVGIVGGKMLGCMHEYRHSAGYFPSPLRLLRISWLYRNAGPFRNGNFDSNNGRGYFIVDWVEGSFLLVRGSLWKELLGFDEKYFMYGEDVDICRRARDTGNLTCYAPSVNYLHHGGYSNERYLWILRGFIRYHKKHSSMAIRGLVIGIIISKVFFQTALHTVMFLVTRTVKFQRKSHTYLQVLKGLIQ